MLYHVVIKQWRDLDVISLECEVCNYKQHKYSNGLMLIHSYYAS